NAGETTFPPRAPFFAIRRAVDDSSRCGCAEDDLAEVRAKPAPPSNQSLGPGRGVVHPAPGDHRRDDGYGRVVPRIAVEDDEVGGIPRQQLAAPALVAGERRRPNRHRLERVVERDTARGCRAKVCERIEVGEQPSGAVDVTEILCLFWDAKLQERASEPGV